ncbi:MAG: FAD-dependent oxidoreductase, partial [Deltaproteobacteria bacterium]|nr:FAD-dependent oxidoreductase [Deltaproteobacteria bacterium]
MPEIQVKINEKSIKTTSDQTILEVVNKHELDMIPTLCHDNRIEPYSSCFLCVVEVNQMEKLVPSCSTKVTEGMEIITSNDHILESRKTALELLLSNHYADCIGPCMNKCPAGVDAQGYIGLISQGKYNQALQLIKQNNPLPLSIGRVCVRDCETDCRRNLVDEAVAINYQKRYVADLDAHKKWKPEIAPEKNKRVAIVGGGPSGLTCAYYMTIKGYKVTIFEKSAQLGGMLRYGIPEYRLPKEILDDEINWILSLGVEVKTGVTMGKDFVTKDLFNDGYDAVYLAVGAQKATPMRLKGEESIHGVLKGIDFLHQTQTNGAFNFAGRVAIIGGGNTAIDAA